MKRVHDAWVGDDIRVGPELVHGGDIPPEPVVFVRARHGVERQIRLHAAAVTEAYRLRKLLCVKVAGARPQAEILAGQIDGVGAEAHRGAQFFGRARGAQYLRPVHFAAASAASSSLPSRIFASANAASSSLNWTIDVETVLII